MDRRTTILPGMHVVSRDGHELGQVKKVLPDGVYFQVDCRMAPDLYVPFSAVHDTSDGAVNLRVTRIESTNLGWEAKPA